MDENKTPTSSTAFKKWAFEKVRAADGLFEFLFLRKRTDQAAFIYGHDADNGKF